MENVLARHRKEQRDLQGRITQKKKGASKKTRKGVNDECDVMERDMKEKQQAEINGEDHSSIENGLSDLRMDDQATYEGEDGSAEPEKRVAFVEEAHDEAALGQQARPKKPNRQKARMARRAAEQEAQVQAAKEEAATLPDLRDTEIKAMNLQIEKRGLVEIFIQPDGHCLYSAVAHGLSPEEVKRSGPFSPTYQNVRYTAADFISKHPDDFAAFLEEPLEIYTKKIKDTAEWGGQLELQAIARAYNVDIHVLQSDGRVEKIESDAADSASKSQVVWLAYYRHSFGLGEHYNALRKAEKT